MGISTPIGVCGSQIIALDCDGCPDPSVEDVVFCGLTLVSVVPVLTDGLTIQDPSGIPGQNCVDVEVDPEVRYYDVSITKCSVKDPRFDFLLGGADMMVNNEGYAYGSKAHASSTDYACFCDCGDDACQARTGLAVWSMNLCPNSDGRKEFHADGRSMITVFPSIQWRPTTDPIIQLSNTAQGQQYIGRAYENPNFLRGPGDIIPDDQAPFDRSWYQFPSDICAPGGCNCGDCGSAAPAPLAFA